MNIPAVPASAVLAAVLLFIIPGRLPAADVVIVNPATPATSLSADLVRDYFLGQKTAWSDGTKVVVVVAKNDADQAPLLDFLGRSRNQFEIGWKKLIFTGRVTTPVQVDSTAAVITRVAATPGAIGFVDQATVTDQVKAVSIR
jgi:ABC-type phosphate transport system substrate-binding protein